MRVVAVIPALDEEASIAHVLRDIPEGLCRAVVVVDNGSTDRTADVARSVGAEVVREPTRGYGQACLTGIEKARQWQPDTLVFLDADYSDYPEQMTRILAPIENGSADLVIGSRMRGRRQQGAMLPQARFGNWLAGGLMKLGWGAEFTDLGPFRAIRLRALDRLGMQDRNYGWTVEMQVKAVEAGLACQEVPVDYRRRIGVSKVTGTIRGTLAASFKILGLLGYYWLTRGRRSYPSVSERA